MIASCEKRSSSSVHLYQLLLGERRVGRKHNDVGLGVHDLFKIATAKYLLLRKYEHVIEGYDTNAT